jgi:hypothetical protein
MRAAVRYFWVLSLAIAGTRRILAHCKNRKRKHKNMNNAAAYLLDDAGRSAMIVMLVVMTSALLPLFLLAIS